MKKIVFSVLMIVCLALPVLSVNAAGTEIKDGFNQQHHGDVEISSKNVTLNGKIYGNVYVKHNGTFICGGSGSVSGNVYASNGSTVIVKGSISGDVVLDSSSQIKMQGGRVGGTVKCK